MREFGVLQQGLGPAVRPTVSIHARRTVFLAALRQGRFLLIKTSARIRAKRA